MSATLANSQTYLSRPYCGYSVNSRLSPAFTNSRFVRYFSRLMSDALARVKTYLARQSNFEPNPYYQGRYLCALLLCLYNHVAHPYEVAEVMFRSSRLAQKIEGWLADRCERFPYLAVKFDGSLGEWKEPQVMAPKRPVENVKAKKASAA